MTTQFDQILSLLTTDPQKAATVLRSNPELAQGFFRAYPDIGNQFIHKDDENKAMAAAVKDVSVEGFRLFYQDYYGRPLPESDEAVAEEFAEAYHKKTGVVYVAWRGKGKSTFLRVWCPYVMGVNPVGSTLLIRINDSAAKKTGKMIADMIQTSTTWKKFFPHVVPDEKAGWSVEAGFNVKDTRFCGPNDEHYAEWLQKCSADHGDEKSLLCAGIESGSIIGCHPTNGEWFDDIVDEAIARSQAEMQKTIDALDGNIIATWFSSGGRPAVGVFCTLWAENDPYQRMIKTGLFKVVNIPVFTRDENGVDIPVKTEQGDISFPLGYKVKLTWPEVWTADLIGEAWRANPVRFGQAYLGDLNSLKGERLKAEWLHEFPFDKINPSWPVYLAVDFATTADKLGKRESDYFVCMVGRAVPGGGMVLVPGGFRGRLTFNEAVSKIQSIATMFPSLVNVGIERFSSGKDFYSNLLYSTKLPVLMFPYDSDKSKNMSKGQKFEVQLAPLFTSGRMWISDVKDDCLNAFVDEWISWNGQRTLTGHDDCLDAAYGVAYIGQGHLMPQVKSTTFAIKKQQAGLGSVWGT